MGGVGLTNTFGLELKSYWMTPFWFIVWILLKSSQVILSRSSSIVTAVQKNNKEHFFVILSRMYPLEEDLG